MCMVQAAAACIRASIDFSRTRNHVELKSSKSRDLPLDVHDIMHFKIVYKNLFQELKYFLLISYDIK